MDSDNEVVIFLANNDFQDEEYLDTTKVLEQLDIGYKISAVEPGECKGVNGLILDADLSIDEIITGDFAGIIFIGGTGIEQYLKDSSVHNLAKSFIDAEKVVAAICWAPAMLALAGILRGKKATVWSGGRDDLIIGQAIYTAEPVTIDGKIITANGPDSATAFGEAVAKAITM